MSQELHDYHRSSLIALLLCFCALALVVSASAQTIYLRGHISTLTGGHQYTDLQAEGNTVVQGTLLTNPEGAYQGALIYDITDPSHPVLANQYNPVVPSPTVPNTQQLLEALIRNGICYFGSGNGGGVHVVNCSDPYHPTPITRITGTNGGGYDSVHEIELNGNFLYETYNGFNGPLVRVINISNPAQPVFVRQITAFDQFWVHATHIRNGRLFTSGITGVTNVFDVTNIANEAPPLLGTLATGNTSHSTWTSEDGNYLYSCSELTGGNLKVFDIHDVANPVLVKTITGASLGLNSLSPHNPVVMGNLLFVSWYQAGLQVFDISNPADPIRIAQYDTFPLERPAFDGTFSLEDVICGFSAGPQSLVPTGLDGNWGVYPFLGLDRVIVSDMRNGMMVLDATRVHSLPRNRVAEFDGDGKTDVSVFRPSEGAWYVLNSSNNSFSAGFFGLPTDTLTPGDYDGDAKTDLAVFRPSTSAWYVMGSTSGFRAVQFGTIGDVPVPGDYDFDGRTDIAVVRPSTGIWYILASTNGFYSQDLHLPPPGSGPDILLTGDFDGDGKSDPATFRPINGSWFILPSTVGVVQSVLFGTANDRPVPGDYDGDARTDIAVFRPSSAAWYVLRSSTNTLVGQFFGVSGDKPAPGDYDADGKTDLAVFRPSTGAWYILNSSNNAFHGEFFGTTGDVPVPAAFVP